MERFLNRCIMPYLIEGNYGCGNPPKELTPQMQKILLDYVYEPYNLDEFFEYIAKNRQSSQGTISWYKYLTNEGSIVCSPMPGTIFYILSVLVPTVGISGITYILFVGLKTIFNL